MAKFADRLEELLSALALRQNKFAEPLGVSAAHISRLLKGGEPSQLFIRAVASIYKVNRGWLETGEGEMFSGENDPFLAHNSEVDVIVAYQSHIAELNKEVVRLRKENTRLIGRAAREPEKPQ